MHPCRTLPLAILAASGMGGAAQAQSLNPGRDYNQQMYERRYDPGAASGPTYHPQNPGQQYNQSIYERRYRSPPVAVPPRTLEKQPSGENSPRVKSLKPARKTAEQIRRAKKRAQREAEED